MTLSVPVRLQNYLLKKINYETVLEIAEKFGENYAADIKQIVDYKIKSCTKQMVKREENILKLMDIVRIAETQRETKSEYQTVYLALVDAICLEYNFYKKSKKGYIALTLLKHGENFWEGT